MEEIKIDNHAAEQFATCPRKFQLRIENGWVPKGGAPALAFGIAIHDGAEAQRKHLLALLDAGQSITVADYDAATQAGLHAFEEAWHREMPDEMKTDIMADDKRSLANGKRLFPIYMDKIRNHYRPKYVERYFELPLGVTPQHGVHVTLTGNIDEVSFFDGRLYIIERKTTSGRADARWFKDFQTSSAIDGYVWAAEQLFEEPIHGAIVHGIVTAKPPKTARGMENYEPFAADIFSRTTEQLEEWKLNRLTEVDDIITARQRGYFRMQKGTACGYFNGCPYQMVCGSAPNQREALLDMHYEVNEWKPDARNRTPVDPKKEV